ncbi:MAG: hypothetical protein ACYDAR_16755 [Thermomicrobiales bacterium]
MILPFGESTPRGIRISERLDLPSGPEWEFARDLLAVIDQIHGDGELPVIPVIETGTSSAGGFLVSARDGRSLRIEVGLGGVHPHLTFVHEIGHFLDYETFGASRGFGSAAGQIAPLMRIIERSETIRKLARRIGRRYAVIPDARGRLRREAVQQGAVRRLLLPEEQFARAYAQYIAMCSQEPVVQAQLHRKRANHLTQGIYYEQWDDDDFAPIAREFDALLREKGWMQ